MYDLVDETILLVVNLLCDSVSINDDIATKGSVKKDITPSIMLVRRDIVYKAAQNRLSCSLSFPIQVWIDHSSWLSKKNVHTLS